MHRSGGGLVASMFTFYSDDLSSNPTVFQKMLRGKKGSKKRSVLNK